MPATGKSVVVIGAGPAGLAAALDLNKRGLKVHLVEKSGQLGGRAFHWSCMATGVCENCGSCLSADLADQVTRRDGIRVHTNSRLEHITRTGTGFEGVLAGGAQTPIAADALLLAAGFTPFNPAQLPSLGYSRLKKVITTVDLNALLKSGRLEEMLPGDRPPAIAFIQCVGSRNAKLGRNYCSQVCCKIALRHANKLLHLYPEAELTVFHLDLQLVGKQFRHFYNGLSDRVTFIQGVPAEVARDPASDRVVLYREGPGMTDRVAGHFDMVVLSVGMGASAVSTALPDLVDMTPDDWGFVSQDDAALPRGVYAAGAIRGPVDITGAVRQGRLAAAAMARDLGCEPAAPDRDRRRVAVVGSGSEARLVAESILGRGYPVVLLDALDGPPPGNSGLEYRAGTRLIGVEGMTGKYVLRLATAQGEVMERAAALVIANGSEKISFVREQVLSLDGLAQRRAEELPGTVAFWLDYAGSEWQDNAARALAAATDLAAAGKTVWVLMEKMLVSGLHGQQRYDTARRMGVKFIRVADRSESGFTAADGRLRITVQDALLPDTELSLACDLLVIPDRVQPAESNADLAAAAAQVLDAEGFLQAPNVRHRLTGSPRRGLFFAGTCHDEMNPQELTVEIDAIAAALDRLTVEDTPDAPAPAIREQRCARCLTCYRTCPHRAIVLQASDKPIINPEACFACGLCVASCPAKAIFQETFDDQDLAGVEDGAHTVIFACRRSALLAAGEASRNGADFGPQIRIQPVPCAGRVAAETMLAPLLAGARRVLVAGCHPGNCRSMSSGSLAARRLEQVRGQTRLSPAELDFFPVAANEPQRLKREILGVAQGKEI
jgi:heterodisulfide reductase subunit A-like polyferredoxin/coenzyme F420-reducing hydrogenase delta subunit